MQSRICAGTGPDASAASTVSRTFSSPYKDSLMSISLIVVVLLVLLLVGAWPSWGYSRSWGYGPTGGVGLILVIVLVLWLLGVF
jgi:hypothetical protein